VSRPRLDSNQALPIGAIIEISPKGFTLGVKAENKNNFFNLSLYGLDLASRHKKDTFQLGRSICKPYS
jgi:hypothetical protein